MKVLSLLSIVMISGALTAGDVAIKAKEMLSRVVPGTICCKADNGWLYSKNELIHLSKGALAGGRAAEVSACRNRRNADPAAALKDFHKNLSALGIKLIVLPVPPKMSAAPYGGITAVGAMQYLRPFYQELRASGLNVLDISNGFSDNGSRFFCRTDAHWSPEGIALAVELLGKEITIRGKTDFAAETVKSVVFGDLAKSLNPASPEKEELMLSVVKGRAIDESSPVLLLGDSHTLIFSAGEDMLAENAGLAEMLAAKLKMPVDRIGVRGSAATAVRINLFRKAARNRDWIKNKKYVIYCFSCREFTEASSGWVKVPVLRK